MPLRAFLEGQGIISLEYSDDQWTELKSKIKKEKIPLTLSCCNQVRLYRPLINWTVF